ncbi:transglycosylase domain-containing protein [Leifsonia sp. YIM 134122]|uniref:Transglycosylase domain-containing protein n=1 Tax=Leifsonia stereocauli TaxID=3134136 RepID=A0ABU9W519_9MICO
MAITFGNVVVEHHANTARASSRSARFGTGVAAFVGFIAVSAIMGLLVAVALAPVVAVTGLAATAGINTFEKLPGYLDIGPLQQKTNVYAMQNNGQPYLLASFYDQDREEVGWTDISQFAKDAAVAAEDPRYYEHGGIDVQGTARAMVTTYLLKRQTQGGSSITQQYVKNVQVQKAVAEAKNEEELEASYDKAVEQTPDRKIKEMRLAIGLEKKYSKDQILRGYLNIALFGGQIYGIEAASNYYFNVSAKDLKLEQAATLIAMVNNPVKYRIDEPDNPENGQENGYAAAKERRDYILGKMLLYKKITAEEHAAAAATPVTPAIHPSSTGCVTAGGSAYFCDFVYWTMVNDPAFGATEEDRKKTVSQGGLDIYTTIDLDLQAAAESAMNENVPRTDPRFDVGSSAVTVQPGSGKVLAMTQNKAFSNDPDVIATSTDYSAINFNTDFDYGGSSGFQPGSTYKVFTLGDWISEGHSLRETFDGRKRAFTRFVNTCDGNWSGRFEPNNDDARIANNAVDATAWSVNSSFMSMASQLDLCRIKGVAEAFGVHRADGNPLQMNPSDVLGTQEIAPITMASAFAGVAAGGLVCKPIVIDRIVKPDGTELTPPSADCKQSVDPKVTSAMAYAMQRTFGSGGTATASNPGTGVPHIGKTGTTDFAKDTWMIGASTKAATAVWVGNVTRDANLRTLDFGSGAAATARHRIWPRIMFVADSKWGGDAFPEPDASAFRQVFFDIPDLRGTTIADAEAKLTAAGFIFADGGPQDSELPAGQVSSTNPSGQAGRGTVVTVYTSNGSYVLMPNVVGLDEGAARGALSQFSVKVRTAEVTDGGQNGKVIASDPPAGAGTKPGTTVTITIGKLKGKG